VERVWLGVVVTLTEETLVLGCVGVHEAEKMLEKEGIGEDPLDRFYQVRLERVGVLHSGIPGSQELLECLIPFQRMKKLLSLGVRRTKGGVELEMVSEAQECGSNIGQAHLFGLRK